MILWLGLFPRPSCGCDLCGVFLTTPTPGEGSGVRGKGGGEGGGCFLAGLALSSAGDFRFWLKKHVSLPDILKTSHLKKALLILNDTTHHKAIQIFAHPTQIT